MSNNFIDELKALLGPNYRIRYTTPDDETKAEILIMAEFNCNTYRVTKTGLNRNGKLVEVGEYVPCGKCHCKYDCGISGDMEYLTVENNYKIQWINCWTAGLYKETPTCPL